MLENNISEKISLRRAEIRNPPAYHLLAQLTVYKLVKIFDLYSIVHGKRKGPDLTRILPMTLYSCRHCCITCWTRWRGRGNVSASPEISSSEKPLVNLQFSGNSIYIFIQNYHFFFSMHSLLLLLPPNSFIQTSL